MSEAAHAIQRLRQRAYAAEKFAAWIENTTILTPDEKREAADSFLDGFDNSFADRIGPLDTRPRIDRRDDAIRDAIATHYATLAPSTAAKALAADLDRVETGGPPSNHAAREALETILWRNSRRALGWRQILNILDGDRGR